MEKQVVWFRKYLSLNHWTQNWFVVCCEIGLLSRSKESVEKLSVERHPVPCLQRNHLNLQPVTLLFTIWNIRMNSPWILLLGGNPKRRITTKWWMLTVSEGDFRWLNSFGGTFFREIQSEERTKKKQERTSSYAPGCTWIPVPVRCETSNTCSWCPSSK